MNHIEAAARAMYERNERSLEKDYLGYSAIPWDDVSEVTKKAYLSDAAAALRAMREVPVTDGMYAAWREIGRRKPPNHARINCIADWRALLGAVIGEGSDD